MFETGTTRFNVCNKNAMYFAFQCLKQVTTTFSVKVFFQNTMKVLVDFVASH